MNSRKVIKVLIVVGFIALNIILAVYFFGTNDVRAWIRSAGLANKYGVIGAFKIYNMAYPPMATALLWIVGKISNITPFPGWIDNYPTIIEIGTSAISIKVSLIVYILLLLVSIYFYLRIVKKNASRSWYTSALIVIANPAFILSTAILGYLDIYFAPFLFLAFAFMESQYFFLSGLLLSLAFSIKLIPIFLLPIFISYFTTINFGKLKYKINFVALAKFLLGTSALILPLMYFFGFPALEAIFKASAAHGVSLSDNAANLNLIIGNILKTNKAPHVWVDISRYLFFLVCGTVIFKFVSYKKNLRSFYLSSILILYTYFVFFTGVHENHLIPALIVALAYYISCWTREAKMIFFHTSLIITLNLFAYYFLGQVIKAESFVLALGPSNFRAYTHPLAIATSIYAIIFYVYLLRIYLGGGKKNSHARKQIRVSPHPTSTNR